MRKRFWACAIFILPVLVSSSLMHAQTASESGQKIEHKGLPPICQGEANRFNCASAPVEGQGGAEAEPAVDVWRRTVRRPPRNEKPQPAPRHDISGTWRVDGVDEFGYSGAGIFGAGAMPSDGYPDHEPPYTKEGLAAYHSHKPVFGMDAVPAAQTNDPVKSCDPQGFPRDDLHGLGTAQILQTPVQMVILYGGSSYKDWRVIWADGRELPKDPDPTWTGYSTGKWVDDTTFIVETNGTDERTWLDNAGRPHSDELRVEERFHRVDRDTLEWTVIINDPKYYTKPWAALDKQPFKLQPADSSIGEGRCVPSEMALYNSLVSDPGNPDAKK
jgi:hypothetical protein